MKKILISLTLSVLAFTASARSISDSATPISVVDSAEIEAVGSTDIKDILKNMKPYVGTSASFGILNGEGFDNSGDGGDAIVTIPLVNVQGGFDNIAVLPGATVGVNAEYTFAPLSNKFNAHRGLLNLEISPEVLQTDSIRTFGTIGAGYTIAVIDDELDNTDKNEGGVTVAGGAGVAVSLTESLEAIAQYRYVKYYGDLQRISIHEPSIGIRLRF